MNNAVPFLTFLKAPLLFFVTTLSLSTTTLFGMLPSSSVRNITEENHSSRTERQEAREEQNVSREELPANRIATEQRGEALGVSEPAAPIADANDRIGITPTTLLMLRRRQAKENYPLAPITVNNNAQADIIPAQTILPAIAPEELQGMVRVHPENEVTENSDSEGGDVEATDPVHYLSTIRKELKEQQGRVIDAINVEVDDQQLEQEEIALNRAVMENGITPEELRVIRAFENSEIINSAFAEAYYHAQRLRLEYNSTLGIDVEGSYLAQFRATRALQESRSAARLAQQADQEIQNAIDAAVETGLRAPAIPLQRQSYSF